MRAVRRFHWEVLVLLLALPASALARPGSEPLVGFGQSLLEFLTGTLGPIVFGLGIVMAAFGLVMGNRDALVRSLYVLGGGAVLFSVQAIVDFVQGAV